MTENLDDLALWGATGDDDQVTPPPDMRDWVVEVTFPVDVNAPPTAWSRYCSS